MAAPTLTYTNPVYPDYFADPFVLRTTERDGSTVYYAYGTGPGRPEPDGRWCPVLRSTDLVHWDYLGGAVAATPGLRDYWAPEVAERDGAFYFYYSCASGDSDDTQQMRVAVADHPAGPFVTQGGPLAPSLGFTIDASPFRDPVSGDWFLYFARDFFDKRVGTGTAVAPLRDDMLGLADEPRTVLRATHDWQVYERNRTIYGKTWDAWHTVEGPFVIYRAEPDGGWAMADGGRVEPSTAAPASSSIQNPPSPIRHRYYCLYSGGSWRSKDYGVGFGVADHPLGPFTDDWAQHGPTVLRGIPDKVLGPGHCSVTTAPDGSLVCVYHAWDLDQSARRMCIDPLVWTPEGPRVQGPTTTPQRMPA